MSVIRALSQNSVLQQQVTDLAADLSAAKARIASLESALEDLLGACDKAFGPSRSHKPASLRDPCDSARAALKPEGV